MLGLVVTLDPDVALRKEALTRLASTPALTVGELVAGKVPLAAETRTTEDESLIERLRAIPGVLGVDVAYAHFLDL